VNPVKWKWSHGDTLNLTLIIKKIKKDTIVFIDATDNTGSKSSDTIVVKVNPNPVINFIGGPQVCEGDTALINLNIYTQPVGGLWHMDTSFLVNGSSFSPALSGPGYFWVRYDYLETLTGCVDTDYMLVVVHQAPQAAFITDRSTGNAPIEIFFTNRTKPVPAVSFLSSWDFSDGKTSALPNPSHVFSSQGTYKVCLTATNVTNACASVSCDSFTILPYAGYLQLGGYVWAGSKKASQATLYLIRVRQEQSTVYYEYTDTTTLKDTSGYYVFDVPDSATYLVKAVPDTSSPDYTSYLPTYLDYTHHWQNAIQTLLEASSYYYDIHLAPYSYQTGPGGIFGKVFRDGTAAQGIELFLTDQAGNVFRYDFSSADGSYSFNNLPMGQYLVQIELTGIQTHSMPLIIDATHTVYHDINLEINSQNGLWDLKGSPTCITGLPFPNPASGMVWIPLYVSAPAKVLVEVFDATGRVAFRSYSSVNGQQTLSVLPDGLLVGAYYVKLITENRCVDTYKIMKLK
jgi:PKD repeat protein